MGTKKRFHFSHKKAHKAQNNLFRLFAGAGFLLCAFCAFLWLFFGREPEGCEGWEIEFGVVDRDRVAAAVD